MITKVGIAGGNFRGTIVEDVPGRGILGAGFNPLVHSRFPQQNLSRFYFGLVDGDGQIGASDDTMVYIMMFDRRESIRFAMWNFYRDETGQPDVHSPAWNWQFVIRNPVVGQQYGYRARVVYKPWAGREDVAREYQRWHAQLAAEGNDTLGQGADR